jgi:hypothetical protein
VTSLLLLPLVAAFAGEAQAEPELWYYSSNTLVHVALNEDGSAATFTGSPLTTAAGFAGLSMLPDGGLLMAIAGRPSRLYYVADPPRDGSTGTAEYLGSMGSGPYGAIELEGVYVDCLGRIFAMDTGANNSSNVGNRLIRFTGDVLAGDLSFEVVANLAGAVAADVDDMGPGIDAEGNVIDNPGFAIDSGRVYDFDFEDGTGAYAFPAGTWGIHAIDGAEFVDGVSRLYVLNSSGYLYEIDPGSGAILASLGRGPVTGTSGLGGTLATSCDTGFETLDFDEDGISDGDDNCVEVYNPDQTDTDGDGEGDACEPITDSDGDGYDDESDNCPGVANADQDDFDGDGLGDACDDDADDDGYTDDDDCDDLDPSLNPGVNEICGDGVDNDCNGATDQDDPSADCDGDAIDNGEDNCPDDYNPGQADLDGDTLGDVCDDDDDDDGWTDDEDNCPVDANADQTDLDEDGTGDVCDDDVDGDEVLDDVDECIFEASTDAPTTRLGTNRWADLDGDGIFDTTGKNASDRFFTLEDTAGCSCAQIIDICGYGNGHSKFGCSHSVMDWWTGLYDQAGEAPLQCHDE